MNFYDSNNAANDDDITKLINMFKAVLNCFIIKMYR